MSVIAKMYALNQPRLFPEEQQVDLTCVCDNRLMAYHDSCKSAGNENRTFNDASPSGDCRFSTKRDFEIHRSEEFYLIFIEQEACPAYPGAIMVSSVRCSSITDFGGKSKQIEVHSGYRNRDEAPAHPAQSWSFNLRMMIDNPQASIQFEPGTGGYWVGIYRASDFDMHEAIADAHSL